jgi:uncharacterized delta-60 repeat protein
MSVRSHKQGLVASRPGRARARVESLEGRALFAAGALDTGWGVGGFATADFGTPTVGVNDVPFAVAVQANGRIVTAGRTTPIDNSSVSQFAVSRHFADGDFDRHFEPANFGVTVAGASAAAVDGSQRVVVAGAAGAGLGVARYLPDGTLDTSFGGDGTVLLSSVSGSNSVGEISLVIDANNRPVVGLTANVGTDSLLAVVRFDLDGTLDENFSGDGVAETNPTGGPDISGGVAIDADGNIVQAGIADFNNTPGPEFNFNGNLVTTRFSPTGARDTAGYGGGTGVFTAGPMFIANSVLLEADGSLLVAGATARIDFEVGERFKFLTLARVAPNGTSAVVKSTQLHASFPTWSLGMQPDGKILVSGNNTSDATADSNYVLARLDRQLDFDPEFGTGGVVVSEHDTLIGNAVAVDSENQILVAAFNTSPGLDPQGSDFILARHDSAAVPGAATVIADANARDDDEPYEVQEGLTIALKGAGSVNGGGGGGGVRFIQSQRRAEVVTATGNGVAAVLDWDLDGDGEYDDFQGAEPTLNAAALDGSPTKTVTVKLRASDPAGVASPAFDEAVVKVNNRAPVAAITGATTVNEGGSVTLNSTVFDVAADTFTYAWTATRLNADQTTTSYSGVTTNPSITLDAPDDGVWTVGLTVHDDDGGSHTLTTPHTVTIKNVAPTASIATATPAVDEGSPVSLNAIAGDVATDALHFEWVVTRNSQTYATHAGTGAAGAAFTFVPNDDALYAVGVTVTDDDNDANGGGRTTAVTQVTAANVAPVPDITGDTIAVRGQQRTLNLAATDPSSVDAAAGFTYTVNWGDGSAVETYLPGQVTATHAYAEDATYSIQVTAMDQDSGTSAPMTVSMLVQSANIQNGVLTISGRVDSDRIRVFSLLGILAVGIDDTAGGGYEFVQTYVEPVSRVVIFGQSGDDVINAASSPVPVEIYGGAGNDTLTGGTRNDILIGSGGADRLVGNGGRDVLIGGRGADRILGDADEDVLVGGYTAHDGDLLALRKISDEWGSTRAYAARVSNLRGDTTGGLNGSVLLRADVTSWDDLVTDTLSGEAGRDWFFANTDRGGARDRIVDATSTEFIDDVDPE